MACFVYVMACEGFLKVGFAGNVASRRTYLQVGNPFPITLVRAFPVDPSLALVSEQYAHALLKGYATRGEWFDAPQAIVLDAVGKAIGGKRVHPTSATGQRDPVAIVSSGGVRREAKKLAVRRASPTGAPRCSVCRAHHRLRDPHVWTAEA